MTDDGMITTQGVNNCQVLVMVCDRRWLSPRKIAGIKWRSTGSGDDCRVDGIRRGLPWSSRDQPKVD